MEYLNPTAQETNCSVVKRIKWGRGLRVLAER